MSTQAMLIFCRPAPSTVGVPIGSRPVTLGRAPGNEVVLLDELVSWHHALLWHHDGATWLRDLGSRNGTFRNDQRVVVDIAVRHGDRVRLGPNVEFRVEVTRRTSSAPPLYVVREVGGEASYPLRGDRFRFGSDLTNNLVDPGARPVEATLMHLHEDEFSLGVDGEDQEVAVGVPFEVRGRRFVVEPDPHPSRSPTMASMEGGYTLEATLEGPTGPEALIVDPRDNRRHRVEADNRAVLLFLLGRQYLHDSQAGRPLADRGWIADEEVSTGIWGRSTTARDTNSLHVLVHRIRKEIADAGLDPWFIEKRRRFIRVRVDRVTVR